MARKVRERAEMKWWSDYLGRYNVTLGFAEVGNFIDGIIDHLEPEVVRASDERMSAARDKMLEALRIMEEDMPVDVPVLMRESGLDPHNRSDSARTRLFLKECDLLTYTGGQPERWIKRITDNRPNGHTEGRPDAE